MALKHLGNYTELGTVGVAYTGGGVWLAYLPIMNEDFDKLHLVYDSECYRADKNKAQYVVYKGDTYHTEFAQDMATEYGDDEECPACFIHIEKDSGGYEIFKKLRKALEKALKEDLPFDSIPEWLTTKDIADKISNLIIDNDYEFYGALDSIRKKVEDGYHTTSFKDITLEFKNGQQIVIRVLPISLPKKRKKGRG